MSWVDVAATAVAVIGMPAVYVITGAVLYKLYNKLDVVEGYAKRANHNSSILLKALIRHNLIDAETVKELEFDGD